MNFNKKYIYITIIALMVVVATVSVVSAYTGTGFFHNIPQSQYSGMSEKDILDKYNNTTCHVEVKGLCTKVVDGDTIYVEGIGKIRFVGVNTPEKGVNGSGTSTDFVKKLCLNKEVGIDVDNSKEHDRYGRTLGVVIVDGKNVNEMLLKEGLAEIMFMPPSEFNPYTWEYPGLINHESSIGDDTGTGHFVGNANSLKFHLSSCKWAKKIGSANKVTFSSRYDAIIHGFSPCKTCNP